MRRLALIAISLLVAVGAVVAVLGPGSSRGAGSPYLVRAIFDNAAFAVPGEDVRIAGANVGSIQSLDVTPDRRHAAVTIAIDDARFTPFYANATCSIRPQSLIGERYVDCDPGTRAPGAAADQARAGHRQPLPAGRRAPARRSTPTSSRTSTSSRSRSASR